MNSIKSKHSNIPDELTLQIIVNPKDPNAEKIIRSYVNRPQIIIQIIFSNDQDAIINQVHALKKNFTIWFNSLWPEQNGGHDNDKAVEENKPDETWGWLVNHESNIIHTDRPLLLLNYLQGKKLHFN